METKDEYFPYKCLCRSLRHNNLWSSFWREWQVRITKPKKKNKKKKGKKTWNKHQHACLDHNYEKYVRVDLFKLWDYHEVINTKVLIDMLGLYLFSTSCFRSNIWATFCNLRITRDVLLIISAHPGVEQTCCTTSIAFENTSSLFLQFESICSQTASVSH